MIYILHKIDRALLCRRRRRRRSRWRRRRWWRHADPDTCAWPAAARLGPDCHHVITRFHTNSSSAAASRRRLIRGAWAPGSLAGTNFKLNQQPDSEPAYRDRRRTGLPKKKRPARPGAHRHLQADRSLGPSQTRRRRRAGTGGRAGSAPQTLLRAGRSDGCPTASDPA